MLTTRHSARLVLVCLSVLLAAGLAHRDRLEPRQFAVAGLDDTALHAATVGRLAAGEAYYPTVGSELRQRGYPAAAVANWRTPLHYRLVAGLGPQLAADLLLVLALIGILLGSAAVRREFPFAAVVGTVLMTGTMLLVLLHRSTAVLYAEHWAGMCIGLSVVAYHLSWKRAAAVLGVAAIFLRELAVPYGLVCGIVALCQRRRSETLIWVAGGVGYLLYYALHAVAVTASMQPTDYAWAHSWLRWLGWPFVLQTVWVSGWTSILPHSVTPIVAVLGLAATTSSRMPAQLRFSLVAYVAFFCAIGQEFNYYWGWITAPLWTFALLYSPQATIALLRRAHLIPWANKGGARHETPAPVESLPRSLG